jgi:hypothetical protein
MPSAHILQYCSPVILTLAALTALLNLAARSVFDSVHWFQRTVRVWKAFSLSQGHSVRWRYVMNYFNLTCYKNWFDLFRAHWHWELVLGYQSGLRLCRIWRGVGDWWLLNFVVLQCPALVVMKRWGVAEEGEVGVGVVTSPVATHCRGIITTTSRAVVWRGAWT